MRRFALPTVLALMGAACASGVRIEQDRPPNLGRYRRVGVLPFTDPRGRGRELADQIGRGLAGLGYDPVDLRQMETVFSRIRIDYTSGLSLQSLLDIRRATMAEALVFGSVDSEFKEASLVAVETEMGELVLNAKVRAPRGRPFSGERELVEASLSALAAAGPEPFGSAGQKDKAKSELPEPQ